MITFRGFLAAYEESRDDDAEREEERPLPHLQPGDEVRALELEPEGHATTPARPLHRGEPRAGAGGARHRPPVDLRLDPRHDPRPRLRVQARHRARAVVPRVRRHGSARAALRAARRLRLHGQARGRPRPDRRRRAGAARLAAALLLRRRGRRRRGPARARLRHLATSTPAPSTRCRSATASCCASAVTGPTSSAARSARACRRTWRRTSSPSEKAEELLSAPAGDRSLGRAPRVGARDLRARPAATART